MADENNEESERLISSKVVKEEIVKKPRSKLALLVLAGCMAAAGYGLTRLDYSAALSQQLTKPYVMKVTNYAVQQGYTEDIWKMFPRQEKYRLVQREIVELPVSESWDLIKPALHAKAKYEWNRFKLDLTKMFFDVKESEPGKPGESVKDVYNMLKQYVGE